MESSAELDPTKVDEADIWQYRQNLVSVIARDFETIGVPYEEALSILMARGAFKWFACRRDIIRLKDEMCGRIRLLEQAKKIALEMINFADLPPKAKRKWHARYHEWKGQCKAVVEWRQRLRKICHSDRWRAADNDREAQQYVAESRRPQTPKSNGFMCGAWAWNAWDPQKESANEFLARRIDEIAEGMPLRFVRRQQDEGRTEELSVQIQVIEDEA